MNSGTVLAGNDGAHFHHQRAAADQSHRRHVAGKAEIEGFVDRRIDGVGDAGEKQRVAVGRRVYHGVGGDVAGGAGTILDDERLAEPVGQLLGEQPRQDIAHAAGAIADQDAHRTRRIIERESRPRQGRRGEGSGGEVQKAAAAKRHGRVLCNREKCSGSVESRNTAI